jgi:hypothetical protein
MTWVNYFDYKWMFSWSFIESEMKLRHGYILHVLKLNNIIANLIM